MNLPSACPRWSLLVLAGIASIASVHMANADELGIVKERPAEGRYVETDRGFMVPYTATIPGSDVTFEMVPVPGGTFTMGSPASEADREDSEGPQVEVTVEPFWIGKHEVRWAEYEVFMGLYDIFKDFESNGKRPVNDDNKLDTITVPTPLYDPCFTYLLGQEPEFPAVTMSAYAARQYTKWLSLADELFYRLPSEAEWEYACRAGSKSAYSFGDDPEQLEEFAWFYDNSDEAYHEVGTKKPNAWGIHDMHGNVAEITLDQYDEETYKKLGGQAKGEDTIAWPNSLYPHVVRGGAWDSDPPNLRSAYRGQTEDWRIEDPNLPKSPWWFCDEPALAIGFRVIRPLNAPAADQQNKYWEAGTENLQQDVADRLAEGRGALGLVDPGLSDAMKGE